MSGDKDFICTLPPVSTGGNPTKMNIKAKDKAEAQGKCQLKNGTSGKVTEKGGGEKKTSAPRFDGPAEIANYSGPFSQTIQALYLILKANPGVEIQIGDYVLKYENNNLVITKDDKVQAFNATTLANEIKGANNGQITPEQVLLLIGTLGKMDSKTLSGKRIDFAKLISNMRGKNVAVPVDVQRALEVDGVVTDLRKESEIAQAVADLNQAVGSYNDSKDATQKPALALAVRQAAEELTSVAAGRLGEDKIKTVLDSARKVAAEEEARVKAVSAEESEFQSTITSLSLAEIADVVDGNGGVTINSTVYTQDQLNAYLGNIEIKKAIGQRILTLLEENGEAEIATEIHPYIKEALSEKANQSKRVIIFEHEGEKYAVVVSGGYDHWKIASKKVGEMDLDDLGAKQGPDDSQPSIYIDDKKVAGQTVLAPAPEALNPNQPRIFDLGEDKKLLYFPESGVLLQWVDGDNDGRIDKNENASVALGVEGEGGGEGEVKLDAGEEIAAGEEPGFSDELFRALYHYMDADKSTPGDELNSHKLDFGFRRIKETAEERLKHRPDLSGPEKMRLALELFNTQDLRNSSSQEIDKAKETIKRDISGINKEEDKAAFLGKRGYAREVAYLVAQYMSSDDSVNEDGIVEFMLAILSASRHDEAIRARVFGMALSEMEAFDGEETAKNYIAWLKGRAVSSPTEASYAADEITDHEDAVREFQEAGSDRKKYEGVWKRLSKDLKKNDDLRYTYYNLILGEAKQAATKKNAGMAIVYFGKALKAVEGFKDARYKDQISKQLFDDILENKSLDDQMLLLAIAAANISGNDESPQRNERLARVAAAALQLYLDTKEERMKVLALKCLSDIPEKLIFSSEDGEKALRAFSGLGIEVAQGSTAEELAAAVNIKLRTDVVLLNLEREMFVRDNSGGVSLKAGNVVGKEKIDASIVACDSIISDSATDYNKAQAYLLKGRLQRARAENYAVPDKLNLGLFDAQRSFRLAYETFKSAEAAGNADYGWEKGDSVFWMCENVRLVAFNLSGAESESSEDKKLYAVMQQLLRFIPPDKTFIKTAALSDWMGQGWPRGNVKNDLDNGMQKQLAQFLQEFCKSYGRRKMSPADLIPADKIKDAQYKP